MRERTPKSSHEPQRIPPQAHPRDAAQLRAIGLPVTMMGAPIDWGGIGEDEAKRMMADVERMRRRMLAEETHD